MAPNNVVINELFGVANGLGMGVMSFDWTQIAWIGSPLVIPWWAELNIGIGFVLFYWIVVPILYYTNVSTQWQCRTDLLGVGNVLPAYECHPGR